MQNISKENVRKQLSNPAEIQRFSFDVIILTLLSINLAFILFNDFFGSLLVQEFFEKYIPPFYKFYYNHVYHNFNFIDGIFVLIYLTEFGISWYLSVKRKDYHRWFFYPIIHFYDLLGSLPFESLRWMRLLRLLTILYRWHTLKIIDLTKNELVKTLIHYYNILMEEITDRVVVNVLEGVKDEVKRGINESITEKVVEEVVKPHKSEIIEWATHQVSYATKITYRKYREETKEYVDGLIEGSIQENKELKEINMIPVVGDYVTTKLEHTISEVVFSIIEKVIEDLAHPKSTDSIEQVADDVIDTILHTEEKDSQLKGAITDIAVKIIDIVIAQVKVQQWKLREQKEKEERQNFTSERYHKKEDTKK